EAGWRPYRRTDVTIIGNVIAEVAHRRCEEGGQPDRIDAEARDMVKVRSDPRQVADPVAIRIGEAARVDLVDRRTAPPFVCGRGARRLLGFSEHCTPHS